MPYKPKKKLKAPKEDTSGTRPEGGQPNNKTILNVHFEDSESYDSDFKVEPEDEIGVSRRDRRLWRLLCTLVIMILVGPSERRFWIHRGILRRHSLFFRGMLRKNGFQESTNGVVKLPEDDVASFATFAEWLYVGDECDTGAIFRDTIGKDISEDDEDYLDCIEPDVFGAVTKKNRKAEKAGNAETGRENTEMEDGGENGEEDGEDDANALENDSLVDEDELLHDHYDLSLQFSCYVLADKLQAPGFKRHILDEIHFFGDFCSPADLTPDLIRYVYDNTARADDPLRKFCILLKCTKTPIEDTLGDPDFQALMEEGGPLVKDVMEYCKIRATETKWNDRRDQRLSGDYPAVLRRSAQTWEESGAPQVAQAAVQA